MSSESTSPVPTLTDQVDLEKNGNEKLPSDGKDEHHEDNTKLDEREDEPNSAVEGGKRGWFFGRGKKGKKSIEVGGDMGKGNRWTAFDPWNSHLLQPSPATMDEAPIIPLASSSFISKLTFWWLQPLLVKGYRRTLQAEDLWQMDETRRCQLMADSFLAHFERRQKEVLEHNKGLEDGTLKVGTMRRIWWKVWNKTTGFGSSDGKRTVGIALALSDTFRWHFWSAGLFKIAADLAQVTSPLVTKQIILFVTADDYAREGIAGYKKQSLGRGIGFCILLFILQCVFSLGTAQVFTRSGQTGVLARGALIAATYRRATKLTGKSRVQLTNSKLVNHISTDISRIDFAANFFHFSYTCIIQLMEVIIILLVNIGVSSLAGVALVCLAMPLQTLAMRKMFALRRQSMKFTDARIKLISELLLGVRIMKLFAWEVPYLKKVHQYRRKELQGITKLLTIRSANQAVAFSIPLLSSILVFTTYSLTGHTQNPALIWTSISLLNLLRMPMMMLPNSLSTITDAHNAMLRLVHVFTSETFDETLLVDYSAKSALEVEDAEFVWESAKPPEDEPLKAKKGHKKKVEQTVEDEKLEDAEPSRICDIQFSIPQGELWMLCGPVGSGKSSLLQGLIGEMRRVKGVVTFGGSVGYCAQTPWISNSTVRENVVFGQPWDENRYWACVKDACLLPDLEQLPNGDMTQIGEKGIALSGGQRQRVSICRTLYFNSDVVLLDDPLSALDAHVGQYIMTHAVLGALAGKTRLLATHALHFMHHADRILCLDGGRIVEQGTFQELMAADGTFARLSREFGGKRDEEAAEKVTSEKKKIEDDENDPQRKQIAGRALMQVEDKLTGAVSGKVYGDYLKAANGWVTVPLVLLALFIAQGSQVLSQFDLVWWQRDLFHHNENFYLGLYGGLGVSSALFTFITGAATVRTGGIASRALHRSSIESVMRAPLSYYDTTPIGRILNRFTKDIDSIDNRLNDSTRMAMVTFAQICGSFILVVIIQHYFLIAVAGCIIIYMYISNFYRQSAREIKRLDNLLRSQLYAHFSESLAGLSTIRAFGEMPRFIKENERLCDNENRAYFLTVINQRWLSVRLDFMGTILTLIISLLSVCQRAQFNPSQVGLILASILSIQQGLSMVIRQSAEVENNISSVERLQHYVDNLPHEAPREIEATKPPPSWPQHGQVTFSNVTMAYRPELPPVLKNMSFEIKGGEKIGIVGRTGAGKSTVSLVLFRIVELLSGTISIDGVDISKLGLDELRKRLAIIPQDALLFNGTLRSNLDPFGEREDRVLWDALKRASLVERGDGTPAVGHAGRFTLDTAIEDEGLNMSVGERSLVSLARALVKDSQVVLLDEATASVDFETDSKVQHTIRTEFASKTLLCIAHRINTIIGYDRILVLDKGEVMSFDTPLNLYNAGGLFHGLCVQSGIGPDDILKSRFNAPAAPTPVSVPEVQ